MCICPGSTQQGAVSRPSMYIRPVMWTNCSIRFILLWMLVFHFLQPDFLHLLTAFLYRSIKEAL